MKPRIHISALFLLLFILIAAPMAVCRDGVSIYGSSWIKTRQQGTWSVRFPAPCDERLVYFWKSGKNFVLDSTGSFRTSFNTPGRFWIHLQAAKANGKGFAAESLMVQATDQGILIDHLPESLHVSVNDRVSFEPRIRTLAGVDHIKWYFLGTRIWQFQSQENGNASFVYRDKGSFSAILSVVDTLGESVRDTVAVIVTDQAPVILMPRDTTVAGHDSLSFGFTVRDDGKIAKVRWDFEGDGQWDWTSTTAIFPPHRYNWTGKERMTVWPRAEVMDDDGHITRDSLQVRIAFKIPRADAGRSTIVCLGDTIVYNGWQSLAPVGEIESWDWDFNGDGRVDTVCATGEVRRAAPSKPGSYSSLLRVVDEYGNKSLFDSVKIVVIEDQPKAETDSGTTVAAGDTIWFHGKGIRRCGDIVEFAWDLDGDGKWEWRNPINQKLPHVFEKPGTYYAKFQVVGDEGAKGNAIRIVRVREK